MSVASQLSVPVGDPVVAGSVLAVHWIVTFWGHEIEGAPESMTAIIWLQVLVLPQPSDAVHVLVMVIRSGQLPATVTSLNVKIGAPVQLSVPVGFPVFAGNVLAVH